MGSMGGMGGMGNRGGFSSGDRSGRFGGVTDNMSSNNADTTPNTSDRQERRQNFEKMGGDNSRSFSGMQLGQNFGNGVTSQNRREAVILIVVSIAVLMAGLTIAFIYKRQL